ncbi:hypothetical protein LZ554_007581 [Drepanopeziza brunnea f. sp. 'monogermtubi']|nr:hypothetical protein LZ554_007581 [Drepanopeziza brunnea f. sp. 'monogermtubi']
MAYYGSLSFDSIFRRCVGCGNQSPACPATCPEGQVCSLVPPTCEECQKTICVEDAANPSTISTSTDAPKSSPNVSAIAGGVIGGLAFIAIVTYLVWKFCIKTKRQQYEQENWAEDPDDQTEAEKDFARRREARASTHTVASIASTVLTRASNIIQIAYIPGVTNRSAPSTPGLLVPPVPPIPIALSQASTPRHEQEHFFMPGDLRDSTYSGITDRMSYARTSIGSTIYGKNAVVAPVPAQTMIRGKAAVVSVKSNGTQPGDVTPPVPSVDYTRFGKDGRSPSPAFSVGSTFLNNANTATPVKPQVVRVVTAQKKVAPPATRLSNDKPRGSPLARDSNAITIIDDTPSLDQGPFSDSSAVRQSTNTTRTAASQVATVKKADAAKEPNRASTPFGDENEVKE